MNNNKLVFGISLAVLVLAIAFIGIFFYTKDDKDSTNDNDDTTEEPSQSDLSENLELSSEYLGDNNWTYTITGYLPNPCYSYEVQALVAESFPEQVSINMTITEPAADVVCAQVIQDVNEEGTFSASEGASVKLNVLEN